MRTLSRTLALICILSLLGSFSAFSEEDQGIDERRTSLADDTNSTERVDSRLRDIVVESLEMVRNLMEVHENSPEHTQAYRESRFTSGDALRAFTGVARENYIVFGESLDSQAASSLVPAALELHSLALNSYLRVEGYGTFIDSIVQKESDGFDVVRRFIPTPEQIQQRESAGREPFVNSVLFQVLQSTLIEILRYRSVDTSDWSEANRSRYNSQLDELASVYNRFKDEIQALPGATEQLAEEMLKSRGWTDLDLSNYGFDSAGKLIRLNDCNLGLGGTSQTSVLN